MDVLVVGAGVAGPVTALALHQAGLRPTVIEAHAPDPDVGSWLTLAPNGLDALAAVGALAHATACGYPTRRIVMHADTGRRLGETGLGRPIDGVPAQTLRRSRLSARLTEEVRSRGIPVHHGSRLVDVTLAPDAVVARFADGGTLTPDLLVGADGIHSQVRRALDPHAPAARYVGLTNFGGITRGVVPDGEPEAWHMMLGRRAFFGWFPTPAGDTVWFVNWPRPQIGTQERARTSGEEWRAALVALLADDGGPAAELVEAGELELVADNTCDLPTVPVWHRGRAVLVGDAAHAPSPTSGQGAALAAEDGVVLAQALRDTPNVSAALATYERHRRRRVERVVAVGARGSRTKAAGPVGRRVARVLLPLVLRHLATERSTAFMYDHRLEWDRPLTAAASERRVPRGGARA